MTDDLTSRPPLCGLGAFVSELAQINCALWHQEDRARGEDDHEVATAKRAIDRLNQRRNDMIEAIDDLVIALARGGQHG